MNFTDFTEAANVNGTGYGCGNPRFKVQDWTLMNLPVAFAIVLFFAFLQPRKRLWHSCCNGKPSIAYPVNLLDSYSDRLAFLCAFGITCIGILDLFTGNYYVQLNTDDLPIMVQGAVRALMAYVTVLAIGLAHYPIMICLTVQNWLMSDIFGLLYTLDWSFVYYYSLGECPWGESEASDINNLILLPIYMCYIVLTILFTIRMYKNYKTMKKRQQGLEVEVQDFKEDFQKTHYYLRVKYLLTPKEEWDKNQPEPGKLKKLWNKLYEIEPGFLYSRRIVCTMGLSALTLYCVGVLYEAVLATTLDGLEEMVGDNSSLYYYYLEMNDTATFYKYKQVVDTFVYTSSPTTFVAMSTMIFYTCFTVINYRRNTLRLWRGDRSFCPKEKFKNTTLVVSSLRYSGYHIAFVIWGFILLQLTLWLVVFLIVYFLILPVVNKEINFVWSIIRNQWLTVVVYLCVYYSQVIAAKFCFLQNWGKELSIDNRRMFHVQVYFYFFVNVILGLASCLLRIFKSVLFGLLLVGRIDRCLLMRGFELYDTGYKAYLGFLQLEVVHTHPVVITFCHFLLESVREKKEKIYEFDEDDTMDVPLPSKTVSRKARNRWRLVFMLMRNRTLLSERFNVIFDARQESIRAQIAPNRVKKKKDEAIVRGAVETFVHDTDEDDCEIGRRLKKGDDDEDVDDADALMVTSSHHHLYLEDDVSDERQVLLSPSLKARNTYEAISYRL